MPETINSSTQNGWARLVDPAYIAAPAAPAPDAFFDPTFVQQLQRQFNDMLLCRRDFRIYSTSWIAATRNIVDFFRNGFNPFELLFWTCNGCGGRRAAIHFNILHDVCTHCEPASTPAQTVEFVTERLNDMTHFNNMTHFNSEDDDPERREINRYIHEDHLAQPCLTPLGRPPYFGVELEVESDCERLVQSAKQVGKVFDDFAIVKRDGSLRCGFEICTRPASFKEHRAQWKRFFGESGKIPIQILDSCGLHVHVARRGLSDLTVAKIVCFINAYHNRRFIRCIAGRSENIFAQIKKKKLTNASVCSGDRYEAVNICRSETIEFRMFKGTLKEAHFFKALEFCDAMRAFCSPGARALRECMMRSEFTHFVHKNAKQWPHLGAFINARWYGRETPFSIKCGFTPVIKPKKTKEKIDCARDF
jgi:hypothetical protein